MLLHGVDIPVIAGRRIGLYGGSFNPAHIGHFHVAEKALYGFGLDEIWWMVSPQNPLKEKSETGDFDERVAATRLLADHPDFRVVSFEERLGTTTTAQTLRELKPLLGQGRFIWVMGADSFAGLDRWNEWRQIPQTLPLGVIDRPGYSIRALNSKAARIYAGNRILPRDSRLLCELEAPAWCFLTMPRRHESSTRIRNGQNK